MTTFAAALPDRPQERMQVLDVLRGFALFGMIVVHFHQRVNTEATGLEGLIGWIVWVGVENKAWGTFAFLFGVGFAVLLRRAEAKGQPFIAFYLRRLAALALFGIAAEALFGFHVLLGYALWGVPLLLIHRLSTRALLAIAAFALAAGPMIAAGASLGLWSLPPVSEAMALREAVESASQGESYVQLLSARLDLMQYKYLRLGTLTPDVTLALFILGLLTLRVGIVDAPLRHVRLIVSWMVFGVLSWAVSWLVLYRVAELQSPAAAWTTRFGYAFLRDQWLCFTFMGTVALLLAYRPVWKKRLAAFGVAGRMALTNYMLQVAVLDYLISGYGVGLRLRPALGMLCAALLFGVEVVLSRWWLRRFRFGPLEWVWRSMTYGRLQTMRTPTEAEQPEVAIAR